MGDASLGGGMGRSNVKNLKTYAGDDAGQVPGWMSRLMQIYGAGQQRANAESDLLFGGKKYGAAKTYFAPARKPAPTKPGNQFPISDAGAKPVASHLPTGSQFPIPDAVASHTVTPRGRSIEDEQEMDLDRMSAVLGPGGRR